MKNIITSGLVLGLFTLASGLAQDVKIEARGIRVVSEGYGGNDFNAELRAFNWSKGTSVTVLVERAAGNLIEIDEDACEFTEFSDDKGTKLNAVESKFGRKPVSISFPSVSKDGKAAMVELNTEGLPAKGATTLNVKGTIAAVVGSKKEMTKSKAVDLKKGSTFEVGSLTFEVEKVDKPDFGDAALEVTLKVEGDLGKVANWTFLKPDGTVIETNETGTMSMGFGKIKKVSKSLSLAEKTDSAMLQLELWLDRETVKIPVDMKVTLGM